MRLIPVALAVSILLVPLGASATRRPGGGAPRRAERLEKVRQVSRGLIERVGLGKTRKGTPRRGLKRASALATGVAALSLCLGGCSLAPSPAGDPSPTRVETSQGSVMAPQGYGNIRQLVGTRFYVGDAPGGMKGVFDPVSGKPLASSPIEPRVTTIRGIGLAVDFGEGVVIPLRILEADARSS